MQHRMDSQDSRENIPSIIPSLWKYFLCSLHLDEILLRLLRPKDINCIYLVKINNSSARTAAVDVRYIKSCLLEELTFEFSHPLREDIPARIISSTRRMLLAITVLRTKRSVSKGNWPTLIFSPNNLQVSRAFFSFN